MKSFHPAFHSSVENYVETAHFPYRRLWKTQWKQWKIHADKPLSGNVEKTRRRLYNL